MLTALLARHLRRQGISVAALKPVASGGRSDARALCSALAGALTLDEINPWHFRAPLAPLLAARREHRRVTLAAVLAHIRRMQKRFELVLVEGAGGLLSPLGEDFNSNDLIAALRATPIVVGRNRLGVVNQVLLTLGALPRGTAVGAHVVLMSPPIPNAAAATNPKLLAEFFETERIFALPWLGRRWTADQVLAESRVRRILRALAGT